MEIARNELVSLDTRNYEYYAISRVSDGVQVGMINFYDGSLYFTISPEFQHQHYCSNAVYLLTKYLHEQRNVAEVSAFVPRRDEISRHICEHAGYFIAEATPGMIVYIHDGQTAEKEEIDTSAVYFAGGCFWGVEKVFKSLDGVTSTTCGYVNGNCDEISYEDIMRNETGFKECVKVEYNPGVVSLNKLLTAFFMVVDPTVSDRQGEDVGTQYQSGVYYSNENNKEVISAFFEEEKQKYPQFCVELLPVDKFFKAEEYHQDYLDKNPNGYCHITPVDLEKVKELNNK